MKKAFVRWYCFSSSKCHQFKNRWKNFIDTINNTFNITDMKLYIRFIIRFIRDNINSKSFFHVLFNKRFIVEDKSKRNLLFRIMIHLIKKQKFHRNTLSALLLKIIKTKKKCNYKPVLECILSLKK